MGYWIDEDENEIDHFFLRFLGYAAVTTLTIIVGMAWLFFYSLRGK